MISAHLVERKTSSHVSTASPSQTSLFIPQRAVTLPRDQRCDSLWGSSGKPAERLKGRKCFGWKTASPVFSPYTNTSGNLRNLLSSVIAIECQDEDRPNMIQVEAADEDKPFSVDRGEYIHLPY